MNPISRIVFDQAVALQKVATEAHSKERQPYSYMNHKKYMERLMAGQDGPGNATTLGDALNKACAQVDSLEEDYRTLQVSKNDLERQLAREMSARMIKWEVCVKLIGVTSRLIAACKVMERAQSEGLSSAAAIRFARAAITEAEKLIWTLKP